MLIQRQLIQHLAAVIRDNKSVPCKRKFRGTFVPTRARIAPKFILPRAAPVVIPFFAYFGNERDSAPRFFVTPLNFRRRYRAENLRNRNELFDDRR